MRTACEFISKVTIYPQLMFLSEIFLVEVKHVLCGDGGI
jgi:hypothetical protein